MPGATVHPEIFTTWARTDFFKTQNVIPFPYLHVQYLRATHLRVNVICRRYVVIL